MSSPSRSAAIETLKRLFADPAVDSLTPDEIYKTAERDPSSPEQNKRWLQNALTPLRHYGFVRSVYTRGRPRLLVGIRLTDEGKEVRMAAGDEPLRKISFDSILEDVRAFQRQNPSIECVLEVRCRD